MEEYRDRMRQLIDLAVSAGRALQSPETRFVHYCYHQKDEKEIHTIPLYDNFLFALSLLRLRFPGLVVEGKELIDKLLYFQNDKLSEGVGSFPIYMHQYPECKDRTLSFNLLLPFYWILRRFSNILGLALTARTTAAAEKLIACCRVTQQEKKMSYVHSLKFAAALVAFGRLWQQPEMEQEGAAALEALREESLQVDFATWYVPALAAESFVALQMVYASLPDSPWKHLWDNLSNFYHRQSLTYAGPGVREEQWGREPQLTTYDYLMGYLGDRYHYRIFQHSHHQLFGALVQPHEEVLPALEPQVYFHGELSQHRWTTCQGSQYALSLLQRRTAPDPQVDQGFYPLRLVWGDEMNLRSFVCQGGNSSFIDFEPTSDGVDLLFYLDLPVDVSHKEKNREILFFFDRDENDELFVGQHKSNTFRLGDPVRILAGGLQLGVTFSLEEGDAHFQGHLIPGNRPAQRNLKGEQRFAAYDWQVILRTVRRQTPAVVRVKLTFAKADVVHLP